VCFEKGFHRLARVITGAILNHDQVLRRLRHHIEQKLRVTYIGLAYLHLGYPDTALRHMQDALSLAKVIPNSLTYAYVLTGIIWCHQHRREIEAIQKYSDMVIALSIEQGFAHRLAQGQCLRGWARAAQGDCETGLAEMCQGLAAYRATEAALYLPYYYAMLSEIHGLMGERQTALCLLSEALAAVESTGECIYAAELYRLKGEFLLNLSADNTSEAVSCYQKALSTAQSQSTKLWELRAATSLARLWQSQHKRREAYDLLAPVYNWFTEGFETPDLIEAKSLLNELSIARQS
jgi:predicted ATPase